MHSVHHLRSALPFATNLFLLAVTACSSVPDGKTRHSQQLYVRTFQEGDELVVLFSTTEPLPEVLLSPPPAGEVLVLETTGYRPRILLFGQPSRVLEGRLVGSTTFGNLGMWINNYEWRFGLQPEERIDLGEVGVELMPVETLPAH